MNCKVCGNAVNYYERTCSVCGNDLEAQRRETAGPGPGPVPARPGSYYSPPQQAPAPSLAQEKDQAVGRILYDNEGSSAHDRLEERRRKRYEEKSGAPQSGFPSFFSQERKEAPPVPPPASHPAPQPPPMTPPPARMPAPEAEERPHRRFSNEFVFNGSRSAPQQEPARPPVPEQYAPAAPEQYAPAAPEKYAPAAPEKYAPMQQSFAIPQAPERAPYAPQQPDYPEAPAYPHEPGQAEGPYFALKPSDDERARFDIDKKNEEFQELLDREFEKIKHRGNEPQGYQVQGAAPSGLPPEAGQRSYVQDRIDEYLRNSELDAPQRIPPQPRPSGNGFEAFRPSAPPAPEPEFDTARLTYGAPETPADFGRDPFKGGDPGRGFSGPEEEPWSGSSYTDFDIYNFPPGPAAFDPQGSVAFEPPGPSGYEPAAYDLPGHSAYDQPGSAAYDQPGSAAYDQPGSAAYDQPGPAAYDQPGHAAYDQLGPAAYDQPGHAAYDQPGSAAYDQPHVYDPAGPAAYDQPHIYDPAGPAAYDQPHVYDPAGPAAYEPPPVYEPPMPEPYAPPVHEEPAQGVTPWGPSRNDAPTRESIAAFIDRPIEFPFDEKGKKGASSGKEPFTPTFDFEPVAPVAYEPPQPAAYEPPEVYEPPVHQDNTGYDPNAGYGPADSFSIPQTFEPPVYEPPVFEPPAFEPPAFETPAIEQPAPEPAQPFSAPGQAGTEYAAPFVVGAFSAASSEDGAGPEHAGAEEAVQEMPDAEERPEAAWPGAAAEPAETGPEPADWHEPPAADAVQPAAFPATEFPLPETPAMPEFPTVVETAEPGPGMHEPGMHEPGIHPPEIHAPDFVDLITEKPFTGEADEDTDGPPAFYKAYTQGLAVQRDVLPAEAAFAGPPQEPQEPVPDFLTAYDTEQLGKKSDEKPQKAPSERKEAKDRKEQKSQKSQKSQKPSGDRKKSPAQKKADARRTALSVIITILIVILVIVVACILVLKFMPGSFGAHYIQDVVELIQGKLGIGGGS